MSRIAARIQILERSSAPERGCAACQPGPALVVLLDVEAGRSLRCPKCSRPLAREQAFAVILDV